LFRDEAALSLARGRASAAAAVKTVDEPARICLIGSVEPSAASFSAEAPALACAV